MAWLVICLAHHRTGPGRTPAEGEKRRIHPLFYLAIGQAAPGTDRGRPPLIDRLGAQRLSEEAYPCPTNTTWWLSKIWLRLLEAHGL